MGKNRDEPSSALLTQQRRFEVWHKEGSEFMPVGSVKTNDLLNATVLTIDRQDRRWTENPQVTAALPEVRSTDIQ